MARPPPFLDHIIIQVADPSRPLEVYPAALKPPGGEGTDVPAPREWWGPAVVLGPPDAEDLALVEGEPASPLHLAFVASDPEAVRNFHAAALASGGRDNGPPGLRERYNPPLLRRLRHRPRRAQRRGALPRPLAAGASPGPMHRSSAKTHSANFAGTEFSETRADYLR